MLEKARTSAGDKKNVTLLLMDAGHLDFPDKSFDYVVTTFVLCSIPDPLTALKEMRRVLKPSGEMINLEHLRSSNRFLAWFEDFVNPVLIAVFGFHENRRTTEIIGKADLQLKMSKTWLSETSSGRSGQNRKKFYFSRILEFEINFSDFECAY